MTASKGAADDETVMAGIDAQLETIVPAITLALRSSEPVFAVGLWCDLPAFSLLPFHLHLRWSERFPELPLNACFGAIPRIDATLARGSLYSPAAATQIRKRARVSRRGAERAGDMAPADWEQGFLRNRADLGDGPLPGSCFLAVDTIRAAQADPSRGGRGILGRHAARSAPRPSVLVPGSATPTALATRPFADLDFLLVDLQGVRGRRALDWVGVLMRCRSKPTLVVASGPTDVLVLDAAARPLGARVRHFGRLPRLKSVNVRTVGEDRVILERQIDFALSGEPETAVGRRLASLARAAWWAVRQSMCSTDRVPDELNLFLRELGDADEREPSTAKDFAAAKAVLGDCAATAGVREERRQVVLDVATTARGPGDVLVLTRSWDAAAELRTSVAERLGVTTDDLEALGLYVQPHRHRIARARPPSAAILCGYFGRDAIDAVLHSRAEEVHLVLDPIEARAFYFGCRELAATMHELGLPEPVAVLHSLGEPVRESAPAFSEATEMPAYVDLDSVKRNVFAQQPKGLAADLVLICFTDGSSLLVPSRSRFDVLSRLGGTFRPTVALDLEPDDEVVLLADSAHAQFSAVLLDALDRGHLSGLVAKRETWLSIVDTIVRDRRVRPSQVFEELLKRGVSVDRASVRSWLKFSNSSDAAIPRHAATFLALAEVLEVPLERTFLLELFGGIRRLRTLHRKAGRDLARAIRLTRSGRLGPISQARLQQQWGLATTELFKAARVAIVDEVLRA